MDETAVVRHVSGSRGPVIKATSKNPSAIDRISDRRSCISVGQYHDASIQGAWQSPYLEHCRCSVGERIGSVSLWRQKSAWNTHCTMRRWLALLESFGASDQIRYVIVILDVHHPTTSIIFLQSSSVRRPVGLPAGHIFATFKHAPQSC